jgi:hypothetical protein
MSANLRRLGIGAVVGVLSLLTITIVHAPKPFFLAHALASGRETYYQILLKMESLH